MEDVLHEHAEANDLGPAVTVGQSDAVSAPPADLPTLAPTPLLAPKRRVDLSVAAMGPLADIKTEEPLIIRELKGVGASFTPNMNQALQFCGFVYKPEGEFDATYQIITGSLLHDSRIRGRAKMLVFAPAFSWATCDVVLVPFKLTRFGARVVHTIQAMQPRFPVKLYVEWSDVKRRHVVSEISMTPQELELIARVAWPTQEEILEALQITAYDSLDDLAAANAEIRTVLSAREVE